MIEKMKFKNDYLYKIQRTAKLYDVILITKCDKNIITAKSLILENDFDLHDISAHYLETILEAKEIGYKEDYPEYFI